MIFHTYLLGAILIYYPVFSMLVPVMPCVGTGNNV